MDVRNNLREIGGLVSDLYTNVGVSVGLAMNGLLAGEIAYLNFTAGETGTGLWLSAAAIALGGLAFHGAYLHDKAEAAGAAAEVHNFPS